MSCMLALFSPSLPAYLVAVSISWFLAFDHHFLQPKRIQHGNRRAKCCLTVEAFGRTFGGGGHCVASFSEILVASRECCGRRID